MNALRALLAHLVNTHVALAMRMTPRAFALAWECVAVLALAGSALAPTPGAGLACGLIGVAGLVMAWANATGRIRP